MPKLIRTTLVLAIASLSAIACDVPDESTRQVGPVSENHDHLAMTENEFWELIESADARADLDGPRVESHLQTELEELSVPQVVAFQSWFYHMKQRAYREDVWDAMEIAMEGCGDDSFMDARAAIIGLGKEAFESILLDPNQLQEYFARPGAYMYFSHESLSYATFLVLDGVPEDVQSELELDLPTNVEKAPIPAGYERETSLKPLIEWKATQPSLWAESSDQLDDDIDDASQGSLLDLIEKIKAVREGRTVRRDDR